MAPLRVNGWLLLFHAGFVDQLRPLVSACRKARADDPEGWRSNANAKLLAAVARLVLETVPADPARPEYRQGNTLGKAYRDWFRVRFFQRFRLFFRYHGKAKVIVFAWLNDETTLRSRGARSDPTPSSAPCWSAATRRRIGTPWSRSAARCRTRSGSS